MNQNPAFYEAAAQIIPVLLIAAVLDHRLRPKRDPLELYGVVGSSRRPCS